MDIGAMAVTVGAVAAAIIGVGTIIKVAHGLARKLGRMADSYLGVEESHPGAGDGSLGLVVRFTALERRVERIEHQVHVNAGVAAGTASHVDQTQGTVNEIAGRQIAAGGSS